MKRTRRKEVAFFLIYLSACILIITGCSREKPVTDAGVKNKELAEHTSEFRQDIIKVTSITNLTIKINLCGRMLKDNFNFNFNYYDHSDY